jgi:hypothetical protein
MEPGPTIQPIAAKFKSTRTGLQGDRMQKVLSPVVYPKGKMNAQCPNPNVNWLMRYARLFIAYCGLISDRIFSMFKAMST